MTTAVSHIISTLRIRPAESEKVAWLMGLMFLVSAGAAIGSPAVEALFFTRFGVQFLPIMYIILGLVTIFTSLIVTALLARANRSRLYLALPIVLAVLLAAARFLVAFDFAWFYPILWLGMNILWIL